MPAKMFGVQTKDDFYVKYIAQGCWARCLQCQKSAGIAFTNSSDNFKSHFVGKDYDGEATLKQSDYVEECAVGSSKNSGGVCAICRKKRGVKAMGGKFVMRYAWMWEMWIRLPKRTLVSTDAEGSQKI